MSKYSIVLLSDLLANYCYIFGDNEGHVGRISEEYVKDAAMQWLFENAPKLVKAPLSCGGYFKVFIPVEGPPGRDSFEIEVVELRKAIIENRWIIRCVYSERANTWVVLDTPIIDIEWRRKWLNGGFYD